MNVKLSGRLYVQQPKTYFQVALQRPHTYSNFKLKIQLFLVFPTNGVPQPVKQLPMGYKKNETTNISKMVIHEWVPITMGTTCIAEMVVPSVL